MIKSDTVKIKYINKLDNSYIENELAKVYKNIVRWAIVEIDENNIEVSLSYLL